MNRAELKAIIRSVIKVVLSDLSKQQLQQSISGSHSESHNAVMDYQENVLTEKQLNKLAQENYTKIRLAKRAVITPLAKDRAKALKISLERV